MELIAVIALVSGGLFAGSVFSIAWDRLPAWRSMSFPVFQADFGRTIRTADKLQPAMLVVALITIVLFGLSIEEPSRILALIAAAGYMVTLAASVIILVPLQRKILALKRPREAMLQKWFTGHLGRTALAILSFGFSVSAVVFSP